MTPEFLSMGGLRLEYRRVAGPSEGDGLPTLVLLHEGLGCVGLWKDFPERLALATGLGVFLWSRAGFGRSDPITLPRPLDYLEREAELIPEVLRAAGIRRAVLIGHSDGGTLALLHAASGHASDTLAVVTMAAHVFVEDVTIEGIVQTKRPWDEGRSPRQARPLARRQRGHRLPRLVRHLARSGVPRLEHRGSPAGDPCPRPRHARGGRRVRNGRSGRGDRSAGFRPGRDPCCCRSPGTRRISISRRP